MTISFATRIFVPLTLLVLLTACDRPKGPPPPTAAANNAAGQATPSTVALSGTILDPQPDPATTKPATPASGAARPVTSAASRTRASRPTVAYRSGAANDRVARNGADPQALRDFQTEQERRDRELLDQDLSEAQLRAREQAWDRGRSNAARDDSRAAPPEGWNGGREAYDLPREDGDWSPSDEPPPDDELPIDEPPFDEPPYDGEPEPDDGYYPRHGAYRP